VGWHLEREGLLVRDAENDYVAAEPEDEDGIEAVPESTAARALFEGSDVSLWPGPAHPAAPGTGRSPSHSCHSGVVSARRQEGDSDRQRTRRRGGPWAGPDPQLSWRSPSATAGDLLTAGSAQMA